jgi:tRNA-specific 2-thiouridylase
MSAQSSKGPTVIVGLSGGVDSSVAALLLRDAGYQVEGLFMKNWEEDEDSEYCTAKKDLADATAVAEHLGIPLHRANFAAEYWDNVFEHFLSEYQAGRTPNPDILCNREIKFKVFVDYARLLGADFIATGHYARTHATAETVELLKAQDQSKDQSYFLQGVSSVQLKDCLFPLGEIEKRDVRRMAEANGLPTFAKKDSTGICFIGERRFNDFLAQYLPAQPGTIVDLDGETLGQHQGLMYHTIGQRGGLGLGGVQGRPESPWYVCAKNLVTNELIVCQGNDHPALFKQTATITQLHWINSAPSEGHRLAAKIRYRQADQACELHYLDEARESLILTFDAPQRAVTPGQWACLYEGDVCLGGGIIESAE